MRSLSTKKRVALGVAVAGLSAITIALAMSGAFSTGSPKDPSAMLGVLSNDQTERDRLPQDTSGTALIPGAIDTSSRYLGDSGSADLWVALDDQGDICLMQLLKNSQAATSSCAAPQQFATSGLFNAANASGTASNPGEFSEAYLVPDGYRIDPVPEGLRQLAPGLLAGDTRGPADVMVFRADGSRGGPAKIEIMRLR